MGERTETVRQMIELYPELPPESVFKEDILRGGISFTEDALRISAGFKPKAYFIFSFDLVPVEEMDQGENFRAPEEICLHGGPEELRRTIVSVRLNPRSPYQVCLNEEGQLVMTLEGSEICCIELPETPLYYQQDLSSGKPVADIAPTIEWGYLLYLTVFRLCQYFGQKVECQFCDINENYRQQKKSGRPYTGVKTVEEILEALEIIHAHDECSRAYTLTGGSITSDLQGLSEVEFYARYARAIEGRFPGRWIAKAVVQAQPRDEVEVLKDAGIQIYHPNYEVWDPDLFSRFCAGKAAYIGRDEWVRRIVEAGEVFRPSHVIPNFVAGIEMAGPHGFQEVEAALDSTMEGLEYFMSQGIVPRFTTWCPEPLSVLGRLHREGAPLAYHVGLLARWRDTLESYELPPPPGYGNPGIGRAVFSVSSFMDVVRPGFEVSSS